MENVPCCLPIVKGDEWTDVKQAEDKVRQTPVPYLSVRRK